MKAVVVLCLLAILVVANCSNNNKDVCLENSNKCGVDPCLIYDCPKNPIAVCRANYCDGCNAEFFLADQKVEC